jgi:translation initiation factor 1
MLQGRARGIVLDVRRPAGENAQTMRKAEPDADTLVFTTGPAPRAGATRASAASAAPRPPATSPVRIWLERKGRNGGPVSIVRGLALPPSQLATLASELKRGCATGGSAKDGEIVIQGDHRARIAVVLAQRGIQAKLAGG